MAKERWSAVDDYLTALLVPREADLERALAASEAAGLPPAHVSPNQGKLLYLLAQLAGARRILELGTLGGYSTLWLAKALPEEWRDGSREAARLITLEADPKHARVAQENFAAAGLGEAIELQLGSAIDTLPQLATEGCGPFDFVFIDADKPNNPAYLDWALRLTRRGSVILVDNVIRDGEVIDASSSDPRVQGVRAMNERLAAEPRLSATAIQTVGSKGYDGFVLARVTADPPSR